MIKVTKNQKVLQILQIRSKPERENLPFRKKWLKDSEEKAKGPCFFFHFGLPRRWQHLIKGRGKATHKLLC